MRYEFVVLVFLGVSVPAVADDVSDSRIRVAVKKTIPWLEKGSSGSSKENKCFTCHNHALPVLALVEAKNRGFKIDDDILAAQIQHTLEHLQRGKQNYSKGKGQGGQVLTAGFALWALDVGGCEPDETTGLVTTYVLNHQAEKGHWVKNGRRPPSDGSPFTANYVALRAVSNDTTESQLELKNTRIRSSTEWMLKTSPQETEDSVYRLKSLRLVNAANHVIDAAVEQLIQQQLPDGGWAQKSDMESDAYATGTVLATLLDEGQLKRDHPAVQSGIRFLLDQQLEDGTWRVTTRADGFQPYYESGFPHEEDQFISIAASSWATMALLSSLAPTDSEVR